MWETFHQENEKKKRKSDNFQEERKPKFQRHEYSSAAEIFSIQRFQPYKEGAISQPCLSQFKCTKVYWHL